MVLKSGIQGEDENLEVLGYDAVLLGEGFARGINNKGDVIVQGNRGSLSYIYSDGEINYLNSDRSITANGINDSGQVVGTFINSDNNRHAFISSGGSISDLGVLPEAETYEVRSGSGFVEVPYDSARSFGRAINNNGQIVGTASSKYSRGYQDRWRAFISDGGSMTDLQNDLNDLFGYEVDLDENPDAYWFYSSEAYGINDLGQVVGSHFYEYNKAFVYGGSQNINLHSLLGDNVSNSTAYHINNVGQIIGIFNTRGSNYTTFVYNDGEINTLGGSLFDLNNKGIAVGSSSEPATSSSGTAILYDIENDTRINLNDNTTIDSKKGVGLSSAEGINDKGQIAASSYYRSGSWLMSRAFLLTQKIRSFDGAVALSSYDGEITIEDDLNAVRGNVTIAAKEGVEIANVTTGVGEVNIGSGKNIVANGNISTNVGYVNLKAGGRLEVQSVTTNDGYISLGADSNVEVQSLATDSGAINLVSATGDVAVAGSINTQGSYVAIEAALEIIASAIEANGGGIDLVANSDFGGVGLIATDPNTTTDVNSTVNKNLDNLSPEQGAAFSEIVSDVVYYSRPVGEFLIGALYATVVNNTSEVFEAGQFLLQYPLALTDRDRRYWTQVINNQSTAFKLGVELANAASIVQGIIEIIAGGGTFAGGAALCTVGAGATFGISCAAGAPAMVTGAAISAHGLSLIKNGLENDTDANLIDDLLAPQKMESTGGADGSRGLAKQLGLGKNNENKVKAGLEVLEPNEFVQFKNDIDGIDSEGNAAKNLFKPLFNKSESIIKKVFSNYKSVNGDADAIADIQENLSLNKIRINNNQSKQSISDSQLEEAFTKTNSFLDNYEGRVSGAFANRFGRAAATGNNQNLPIPKALDFTQAAGEIKTAEDILDGNTILGNGVTLRGLPDTARSVRNQTNPEYFATMLDNSTRLVEVKTPTGNPRSVTSNLNTAIGQIAGSPLRRQASKNAYIRIDYSNGKPGREDFFFGKIESSLIDSTKVDKNNQPIPPGIQIVEFVEFLYKDVTNNNQVTKMLVRVENGIPNIFRGN